MSMPFDLPPSRHTPDEWLRQCFRGPSPLSRRTLRRRLRYPARAYLSAVLFSAEKRGLLGRTPPPGNNSAKIKLFQLLPPKHGD